MTAPLKHSNPITVDVALGDRAYDIVIGRDVLHSLGERVAALRPGVRTAIVTDRNVAKHWLEKTEASLSEAGIATARIIVGEGEGSKTYDGLERVSEALIAAKIERNDLVIALGGGVVGDLAGFAAAILRRGVDFVQVPTSLLAQVDSSVGGKTGINSPRGKNLLGAFHQPVLVVADTAVLDTLSPRQFRAGYAEVAKYGVLGDEAFFGWLEANHADIFAGGAAREHAIATPSPWNSRSEKPVAASSAWPKVWPRLSSARSPVSRSSRDTIAALARHEVAIACSRAAPPLKMSARLFSSQVKNASSPSTPYLATSA